MCRGRRQTRVKTDKVQSELRRQRLGEVDLSPLVCVCLFLLVPRLNPEMLVFIMFPVSLPSLDYS